MRSRSAGGKLRSMCAFVCVREYMGLSTHCYRLILTLVQCGRYGSENALMHGTHCLRIKTTADTHTHIGIGQRTDVPGNALKIRRGLRFQHLMVATRA